MGFIDWIFNTSENKKIEKKRVFISFAIEDKVYRNYLVEQSKKNHSPFTFIDMSVKKEWHQKEWKKRCRTKIKRSHGVIALLSKNSYHAGGARWEMKCANEENKKIIGMHIKKADKGSVPPELSKNKIIEWNWENLKQFINNL